MHTLNAKGWPDTLHLDPVPTYDVTVHTIPPMNQNGIRLNARAHNRIVFPDAGQGLMQFAFARNARNPYSGLIVELFEAGDCEPIHSLPFGEEIRVLQGKYDVLVSTVPPTLITDVQVGTGLVVPVQLAAPGDLVLDTRVAGYGAILDATGTTVIKFDSGNPSGRYNLQPGTYHLVFRARGAQSTDLSVHKTFNITSGNTTNLNTHG